MKTISESYAQTAERLFREVLRERGESCCLILTIYEPADRDYWFRFVLGCRVHLYRTVWFQLLSDDEPQRDSIRNLIAVAESETPLVDHPWPYPAVDSR